MDILTRNPQQIVKIQGPRHERFVDQSEASTTKGSDEGSYHRDPVTHWYIFEISLWVSLTSASMVTTSGVVPRIFFNRSFLFNLTYLANAYTLINNIMCK